MKEYTNEIKSIEQINDDIKHNIINDIKEIMTQNKRTRFILSNMDDGCKEGFEVEYEKLLDDIIDDIELTYFEDATGYIRTEPLLLTLKDNGELMIECYLFSTNHIWDDNYLDTLDLNENQIMNFPLVTLNQILLNIQNVKFQRINDLYVPYNEDSE